MTGVQTCALPISGHPLIYATSRQFMDYFGLNSPEELPKLKEIFDEALVQPTVVQEESFSSSAESSVSSVTEESTTLVVSESGELRMEENEDDEDPGPHPAS